MSLERPQVMGLDATSFKEDWDGVETVAYVHVSIPVGLAFDRQPRRQELLQAAWENFCDHPALRESDGWKHYCDKVVLEKP